MKVIELTDATASLDEYARGVGEEPVVITRAEEPLAALVSISNTDLETISLSTNPDFLAIIERSRARQRQEGGIPIEEVRRRLAVDP